MTKEDVEKKIREILSKDKRFNDVTIKIETSKKKKTPGHKS